MQWLELLPWLIEPTSSDWADFEDCWSPRRRRFCGRSHAPSPQESVVLKLNGGLGTGMGLDFAKSLLKVKGNDTFLDLTAKQVISMRKALREHLFLP